MRPDVVVGSVELDLDGGLPPEPPPTSRPRGRPSHARGWVGASLALVIAGVLAAPVGGVPLRLGPTVQVGMLEMDLRERPSVAWTTPVADHDDGGRLVLVDGVAVLLGIAGGAAAFDVGSGSPLWSLGTGDELCQSHDAVVCVVDPMTPDAVVRVVDARTGETSERAVPGAVAAVDAGGDLVVVADASPANPAVQTLTRLGPDGQARWQSSGSWVPVRDDARPWVELTVSGELLTIGGNEVAAVDLTDGGRLPTGPATFSLDGRTTVEVSGTRDGVPLYDIAVDGEDVLRDEPLLTRLDDDLGGPVQLMLGPPPSYPLLAIDRASEQVLWRSEVDGGYPAGRIDGAVLMSVPTADGVFVRAVEERTGRERWRQDDIALLSASGGTLLAVDLDAAQLHGVDTRSGELRWSLPLVSALSLPARWVPVPDGMLLLVREGGPDSPLALVGLTEVD